MSDSEADDRKPAGKLQKTKVTKPNSMLGIDLMGPLSWNDQKLSSISWSLWITTHDGYNFSLSE